MLESRWLRWAGPGLFALGTVAAVVATASGAGQRPWTPRDCPDDAGGPVAARSFEPAGLGDMALVPWYRLDPRLDPSDALQGQRLALGTDGDRSSRVVDLPPESFASGPFGPIILVGADDGVASRLEAIDPAAACSWIVGEEPDVVRRATIGPLGDAVYEMRVDRATRADLGIWSRPLDGRAPAVRVLQPMGYDEQYGPTFSTEFAWDVDGRGLAIQSCGEMACRTRILGSDGESLRVVEAPDLGTMVGLAGDILVSYVACPGLPCPILATDVLNGSRSVVADAAGGAALVVTADGPRLVAESGTGAPSGWVVLSPDGRIPSVGPSGLTQLRHVPDGATVQLDEVAR